MRKLFAFLLAIILAFLVATGALLYKKRISLNETDFGTIKELWGELLPEPGKTDNKDTIDIIATDSSEAYEENLSYDERIEKGDYYFERGFLTFASNEYVKAANLEPDRIEPYQKLLLANYELGDYTKAISNAETLLSMSPNDFSTKFTLALIYIKQSDFKSATIIFEELAVSEVTDPEVNYYRGLLKIAFDDHDEGKKFLKQAKSDSDNIELDEKIDYFLDAYTEYEFAKAAEELYLSELLSRAYNKVEEYEMAIYKLKNVLKTRSDLRDAWILFGFAYLNLESYYFAQTAFERAYDLDSQWPTTQYFLGLTHAELGNNDEAIIYLNYALANGFEPAVVIHQRLADLYIEIEDYTNAVVSYEEVLDINNEDINSFVRPIWIYLDYLNEPEKALELAEIAVVTFPETAMSYNLLGWSQIGTNDQTEAEKNLKKATELDPNFAASYYNLGKLYEVQNRDALAIEVYQKAYELDPSGSIGNLAAQRYNVLMTE